MNNFLKALITSVNTWRSHLMKMFDVRLRLPADLAAKMFSEYSDYYKGCDEVMPLPKVPRQHYANGKRKKDIGGRDLILKELADGLPHSRDSLQKAMIKHEFAPSSIHPQLSQMVRAQEIKRLPGDFYVINTATSATALNLPGHGVA